MKNNASVPNLSVPNVFRDRYSPEARAGEDRALRLEDRGRGDPRDDHVDPRHDDRQRRARTLGHDLHSSISQIQWVVTGYLLSLAAVIPVTGWAARRFGAKRVYLTSLVLFTLGSALCAVLATTLARWSLFRVLQGAGGGMIMPLAQLIMAQVAGPQRMGRVMGDRLDAGDARADPRARSSAA